MSKIKLATVWLDGCSGCHMSVLDVDEGIVAVLKKADIVFGPLVDAQEFPEGTDVAIVEGAEIGIGVQLREQVPHQLAAHVAEADESESHGFCPFYW